MLDIQIWCRHYTLELLRDRDGWTDVVDLRCSDCCCCCCYWTGQSPSHASMELIGRKAGDLSANCPTRDVHSAGIRQLIYRRPPARSAVPGDVLAEITRSKVKQCRRCQCRVRWTNRTSPELIVWNRPRTAAAAERDGDSTPSPHPPIYYRHHDFIARKLQSAEGSNNLEKMRKAIAMLLSVTKQAHVFIIIIIIIIIITSLLTANNCYK